jgi:uncharacterized RDD family membrane protein YckC
MGVIALVARRGEEHQPMVAHLASPFFRTYLLLVCFFFYGGFWVHGGQTLGMRAWRLRLQRRNGGRGYRLAAGAAAVFERCGLWLMAACSAYLHQVVQARDRLEPGHSV